MHPVPFQGSPAIWSIPYRMALKVSLQFKPVVCRTPYGRGRVFDLNYKPHCRGLSPERKHSLCYFIKQYVVPNIAQTTLFWA
jgi:hypothetical protein